MTQIFQGKFPYLYFHIYKREPIRSYDRSPEESPNLMLKFSYKNTVSNDSLKKRYKITVEYDGSRSYGWQRQRGVSTVQQTLEEAVFKLTHQTVLVEGAGRTDAGVHATGQVAHFDLEESLPFCRLQGGLNYYLRDKGIGVIQIEEVDSYFHARFSAKSRAYRYIILNRRTPPILDRQKVWHVIPPLNVEAMQEAAQSFIGFHNFEAFRSAHCQASSAQRTLTSFYINREGEYIYAKIQAPSFLHNQVRIMVGTLKKIGEGLWPPNIIPTLLENQDRCQAGPTAPPFGLYLTQVTY